MSTVCPSLGHHDGVSARSRFSSFAEDATLVAPHPVTSGATVSDRARPSARAARPQTRAYGTVAP